MDHLFIGTYGHVAALEKATGREVWRTSLPGTGYRIVTLLHEGGTLFAASRGHVFALDPADGRILWENGLGGLGYDHVFMTTERATTGSGADLLARAAADEEARRNQRQ